MYFPPANRGKDDRAVPGLRGKRLNKRRPIRPFAVHKRMDGFEFGMQVGGPEQEMLLKSFIVVSTQILLDQIGHLMVIGREVVGAGDYDISGSKSARRFRVYLLEK